jgi:hypothetical protein
MSLPKRKKLKVFIKSPNICRSQIPCYKSRWSKAGLRLVP